MGLSFFNLKLAKIGKRFDDLLRQSYFSQVQTEVKAAVSLWFQNGPTVSQNGAKFPRNGSYESDDFDGNLPEAIHVQVTCMIQPLVYNLSLFLNAGFWRLFPVERA